VSQQFFLRVKYQVYQHDYGKLYYHVRPQLDFVYDLEGKFLLDDLFRLEEIGDCIAKVRAKRGVRSNLVHVNASRVQRFSRSGLTDSHKYAVEELYHADFEVLRYDRKRPSA